MKPNLRGLRLVGPFRLPLDSSRTTSSPKEVRNSGAQAFRMRSASAILLLLLPLSQTSAFAQQMPSQAWPQNNPYNGQYAPSQQPAYPPPSYQQPAYSQPQPYAQQGYPQPMAQPLSAEQLEQLLAPIALYPDALLAQVLAAATYPAQVVGADHWLQAQGFASADQIAAAADAQPWDPSVKGLTAFPQVLAQMDRSLQWTTDLGNAYYNQPQDVLESVQVLRQRAQTAGTLQNTPQEAVTNNQGYIQLAPVNPQVVYVPAYNPWDVYGQPVQPYPGFSLLGALQSIAGSAPLKYGLGIAMAAFNHTSFGWMGWALNWLTQSVLFNGNNFASQSTSVAHWASPRGGSQRTAFTRQPESYNRTPENYGRSGNAYDGRYAPRGEGSVSPYGRNQESYGANRSWEGGDRPHPEAAGNYTRPVLQAYNHSQAPSMPVRPQPYGRPAYASGFYGRSAQTYATPQQAWRTPTPQRGDFGQRGYSASAGRSYLEPVAKPQRSGGFHLFGSGHNAEKSYGGGHAPKSFSGGKHSGGGGHSSSHHGSGHRH
jgi:hypothetical protein